MSRLDYTVNVDEYLALNKYEVDEESAHIELAEDQDPAEFDQAHHGMPGGVVQARRGRQRLLRLRRLLGVRHLPHHLRRHHHQEVGETRADMGVEYRFG